MREKQRGGWGPRHLKGKDACRWTGCPRKKVKFNGPICMNRSEAPNKPLYRVHALLCPSLFFNVSLNPHPLLAQNILLPR